MKILYVVPAYEPAWAFGGVVTASVELCREISKQGVDVTVYTTNADGKGGKLTVPTGKESVLGGVKTYYFPYYSVGGNPFYSPQMGQYLIDNLNKYDLIHVSAIWQLIQLQVYNAAIKMNKPYIISPHGSFSVWPWQQGRLKKMVYWHLFSKKTISAASAIHFTAQDERTGSFLSVPLLKSIPNMIVPNGIEIKAHVKDQDVRQKLGISSDKLLILYVGRLHTKKGLHFIAEAINKLANDRIVFLLVGPKEDQKYYEYLLHLAGKEKGQIIWLDSVPHEKVWNYYYAADLFAMPSYDENFGLVVVEAMSCGLPVLISKNVAIWQETLSGGGGFVVNQNSDEIALVLKRILENREVLKKMAEKAISVAQDNFNIHQTVSLMIRAYEDVLMGRRSRELQWK
ncbi:MAG: glycosyltransferase [Candidatus Saganbacteria bacterium]|nr:glycosyltransferase [Candidatus Saganbacteria bacterium]